jgi:DedD protein
VVKPAAPVEPQSAPKPAEKAAAKAADKVAAKPAAAAEDRFVVQVGAFADVTRAREARLKLERAGLKTYTQVVDAKEGRRIRVRVGPFATKAQADKAAEKIRKLDLPASVLTL